MSINEDSIKLFQQEEEIENVIISKINYITNTLLRNDDLELQSNFFITKKREVRNVVRDKQFRSKLLAGIFL